MTDALVFFGTGPVALAGLKHVAKYFSVEAVITKPDRYLHGQVVKHPVKDWATEHHVEVFQPADKSKLRELFVHQRFDSRFGLVIDYGLIIPEPVIASFPLGIINSHFSLLPKLRGPDPITFAILTGIKQTGVSVVQVAPKLDGGKILAQARYDIGADVRVARLTEDLSNLSNKLLQDTLPKYLRGEIKPRPQDTQIEPTHTRKLTKGDGVIDWTKPAVQIEREVRAFLGWPGSQTTLASQPVIVTAAHIAPGAGQSGQADVSDTGELSIYCGEDRLIIDRLKPAGKPEMTAQAYLAGHRL